MKKFFTLVLAMVLLLGILAGCGAAANNQIIETVPTTVATAPAEVAMPTETSSAASEDVKNTLPFTPSQFFIGGALLDIPGSGKLYNCGGEMIRPIQSNLKDIDDEIAIVLCDDMHIILKSAPCKVEDFQQAGVNFAYLLVNMSDSEALPTLKETARNCFDLAKESYTMDQVYPWVLVGLACPEIMVEYFAGDFSENPDQQIIEQVQNWIPRIMHLQESAELADAINRNPWFRIEE